MKHKLIYGLAVVCMMISATVSFGTQESADRSALSGVNFKEGTAELTPGSEEALTKILEMLKADVSMGLRIESHTDNQLGAEENVKLSQSRAQVIVDWLVKHGVEKHRLEPKGFGDSKPIADNSTPDGRLKNQRIEIVKFEVKSPAAFFPEVQHEFAPVLDGSYVTHDFMIQNKGNAPLNISRVKTG